MRLVLLGPPGAGKGTQAKRMSQRLGVPALSSGDILRSEIKEGSEVGKKAYPYLSTGALVPDDVITAVMLEGIRKALRSGGFILDGFPRTTPQAEALGAGMAGLGIRVDGVLNFDMQDREIVQRITGRRSCGTCGAVYNLQSLPPRKANVCDVCGSELTQRVDDREDVIVTRLAAYRAQTAPLVHYYAAKGLLKTIDASASPDNVEAEVSRIIDELGGRK